MRIIVSAKKEENVRLLRQGGADAIVSPATFGGYILAAAVEHGHMVHYVNDLLTAGGNIRLVERPVRADEVGKRPEQLKPDLLLQLYRDKSMIPIFDLDRIEGLRRGDIMVLLTAAIPPTHTTEADT